MDIIKLLTLDSKCRYEGITGDLYLAHQLSEIPTWNYSLPTLVSSSNSFSRNEIIKSNITFTKKFFASIPFLKDVDLSNLLIAGGSVRSILVNSSVNDIDIFMYGIKDINVATKRIEKLILDIRQNLFSIKNGVKIKEQLDDHKAKMASAIARRRSEMERQFMNKYRNVYNPSISTKIDVYSNGNTITLSVGNTKVQVILRLYNTISEILHGFDLGSSSVGFDGTLVYFTSLSKFCFENMVNILDSTRRSTTYEVRLVKYFEQGFNIILPNLDMTKLRTQYHKYSLSEVCELPYMKFSYNSIVGNSICVDQFFKNSGGTIVTDYDFYETLMDGDDENKYPLLHYNLGELISGKNRFVIKVCVEEELAVLKSKKINLNEWKLKFDRLPLDYKFIEYTYNKFVSTFSDANISKGNIQKYISIVDLQKFVTDVYLSDKSFAERKDVLKEYVQMQKAELIKRLDNYVANKAMWITENAGTQLTSSINPVLENAQEWYGDLFVPDEVLRQMHGIVSVDDVGPIHELGDVGQFEEIGDDEQIEQIEDIMDDDEMSLPKKSKMNNKKCRKYKDEDEDEEDDDI